MGRQMVDAYKEYFMYSFEDLSLIAGTGVAFEDTTVKMDSDSDFEIMKRSHIATSDLIRVKYQDDSYGRQFQNASMDLRAVSGTTLQATGVVDIGQAPVNNFMPYILPRPYLIRAGTTYTASYADFSGVANSIRETFHGAKVRQGKAPWDQEWKAKPPYDYTTAVNNVGTVIAAGGTASLQISIGVDAHFLVQKIVGTRTSGAPALVTIRTGGNDRQWMDKAVHFDNLVGNAQFPNVLPAPRLCERGSTISITVQNLSSVFSGTYEIILSGLKLF
jgi:hypothetical protein